MEEGRRQLRLREKEITTTTPYTARTKTKLKSFHL
jgi:hypothetical protein